MKLYDIPFQSLIARDGEGLMMAGRSISGDFSTYASYCVTGNAVTVGGSACRYCCGRREEQDYAAQSTLD